MGRIKKRRRRSMKPRSRHMADFPALAEQPRSLVLQRLQMERGERRSREEIERETRRIVEERIQLEELQRRFLTSSSKERQDVAFYKDFIRNSLCSKPWNRCSEYK